MKKLSTLKFAKKITQINHKTPIFLHILCKKKLFIAIYMAIAC